jgi:PTH1 family peptidyl-tRNA hydrolase
VTERICVIGLGNPGERYRSTRHNIGFEWVDAAVEGLTKKKAKSIFSEKFESLWFNFSWESWDVHFLKPLTFMNNSGRAASQWLEKFQGPSRLLVVLDEMDLALGRIRLRGEGSDGGHRGLRSILESVGHTTIARFRLGIGRPSEEAVEHVLDRFSPEERKIVDKILVKAVDHLSLFMKESLEMAMSRINGERFDDGP